jgi:multiple sugar transport system permease protein
MVLWIFVKRNEGRRGRYALFLAATELLMGVGAGLSGEGGAVPVWAGLAMALLFLLGSRRALLFRTAVLLELGCGLYGLLAAGFLGGLHLPALVTAGTLVLMWRRVPPPGPHRGFVFLRRRLSASRRGGRAGDLRQARGKAPAGFPAELLWSAGSRLFAGLMLVAALLVLYMVLWLSFSDLQVAYIDRPVPRFFTLENYRAVFVEEGILRYFGNTLLVAGLTALLVPAVTFPAAYAVVRMRPAGAGRLFSLVQMLGLLGGMHALIPLFALFRHLGLINTYVPVVLIYLLHAVPFALFSTAAYLERLPKELEETARLEGAGYGRYLLQILLPLALPAVAAGMMVAFIGAWNGFLVPLLFLQDDGLFTIGVKLHEFVGSIASGGPRWGIFAAASTINMLLIGVLLYRFRNPLEQSRVGEIF